MVNRIRDFTVRQKLRRKLKKQAFEGEVTPGTLQR